MLDKLIEIAKNVDLQDITGLTDKQIQLTFFLIYTEGMEFSFGELKRGLNDLSLSFTDSTLSRNLKKLEEKQVIVWDRAEKLRFDRRSKIRLKMEGLDRKLGLQKEVEKMYYEFVKAINDAKELDEQAITDELIKIAKDQAGGSLFLKFWWAQGVIDDSQFGLFYMWFNMFCEKKQDIYMEVIKERGKKSLENVMHFFLQSGIKIDSTQ